MLSNLPTYVSWYNRKEDGRIILTLYVKCKCSQYQPILLTFIYFTVLFCCGGGRPSVISYTCEAIHNYMSCACANITCRCSFYTCLRIFTSHFLYICVFFLLNKIGQHTDTKDHQYTNLKTKKFTQKHNK